MGRKTYALKAKFSYIIFYSSPQKCVKISLIQSYDVHEPLSKFEIYGSLDWGQYGHVVKIKS